MIRLLGRFMACSWLVMLLGSVPLGSALASETVVTEGIAVISGDISRAREAAVQDAIRRAAVQSGGQLRSETAMTTSGRLFDRTRMRATAAVEQVEVLEEQQQGGTYRVRARITLDPTRQCDGATPYRPRIAALAFPLVAPQQQRVGESAGFSQGVGRAIVERLADDTPVLLEAAGDRGVYPDAGQAPQRYLAGNALPAPLYQLGQTLGAQYLLAGVIHDIGLQPSNPSWLGFALNQRHFEIEIFLYDAILGDRLFAERYGETARGRVRPDDSLPFGSRGFFRNAYGKTVAKVLEAAAKDLHHVLACRPFLTRVAKVKGDRIWIQAGTANLLAHGATLTLYRSTDSGSRVRPRLQLSQALGQLAVTQVASSYAVVEPDTALINPPRAGDIVAGW